MVNNIRNIIGVALFCLLTFPALAQKFESFGQGNYGVRNRITKKVLIPPIYDQIIDFNDTLIIVRTKFLRYGAVDSMNNIVIPFSQDRLFFRNGRNHKDRGAILEESQTNQSAYFIDRKRNCIPHEYFLCPCEKTVSDGISEYWTTIQTGYKYYCQKSDSALTYYYLADKMRQGGPYPLLLINSYLETKYGIGKTKTMEAAKAVCNSIDSIYSLAYTRCIDKEDSINVLVEKINFYTRIKKNDENMKNLEKEARLNKLNRFVSGPHLLIGTGFYGAFELETGICLGFNLIQSHYWSSPKLYQSSALLGATFLHDFINESKGVKFYLLSSFKVINAGIYPIVYFSGKNRNIALRPEIGLGFRNFSFGVGTNWMLKKTFDQTIPAMSFNVRMMIPVLCQKNYSKG